MKFLKSYDKYQLAFKQHNSEHLITKHDQIDSIQSSVMIVLCISSIIASIFISYQIVMYFDWVGPAGIPIFFLSSFLMIMSSCLIEDKLFHSDSKMNIICNEIKDNIHENEKAILAFYLEVRNFLSLHHKNETDLIIMNMIDNVIEAYALDNVQPQHVKKIMQINKYVEDEYVFKRFLSLSDETINKIEQYKAILLVEDPSIEKKTQYAEMV